MIESTGSMGRSATYAEELFVAEIERLKQELSLAEEGLANYAQENAQLKLALDTKLYSRRKLESDNKQLRAALQDLADCCGHDDDKALLIALTSAAKTLLDCSCEPQTQPQLENNDE